MRKSRSIKLVIYNEYLKAAILPILLIEFTLLITYFIITGYLSDNSKKTLQAEATLNIGEIASRETRIIDQQIKSISRLGVILQKENSRLFENPGAFGIPAGIPAFATAPNGVHYKTTRNGGSSLWYSAERSFDATEKNKAILTEAMDPLYRLVLEANPNIVGIYFNSWDSMNRYYPYLENTWNVYVPTMKIPDFNFYYLADRAHNPGRGVVWTDTYLDPAGQGWMTSCIMPVYRDGFLEGVTGIDVTIDRFVENILSLKLPWKGSAFLIDQYGVIIAMPESVEGLLGLKELREQVYTSHVASDTMKPEEFNLFTNKDPLIAGQIRSIFSGQRLINDFTLAGHDFFLSQSIIPETGWRLMILVDKEVVNEPVDKLDRLTRKVGLLAFVAMVFFYAAFFSFLLVKSRKTALRIATPLRLLGERTTGIMNNPDGSVFSDEDTGIDEINLLNNNFSLMAKALGAIYAELENKVKSRTAELESALANLQNAQQQIIQQEKMASIGQLAAGVAHEINNPMSFVITNVNLLKDYFGKVCVYLERIEKTVSGEGTETAALRQEMEIGYMLEEIGPMLDETLTGTERVKKIVNELRTFSRLTVEMEMTDVNGGITSVIGILWNELKYKVEVKTDFGELPPVQCNPGQINQVFMNIILNGAQAIADKGIMTIITKAEGERIRVVISDNGSGMPKEVMARIFEPFFTTKEPGKGTGLGLSVSYEIIAKHQGTIEVQSEAGNGTTFIITLPVFQPQGVSVPVFSEKNEETRK